MVGTPGIRAAQDSVIDVPKSCLRKLADRVKVVKLGTPLRHLAPPSDTALVE
jgi:hypothetical protein